MAAVTSFSPEAVHLDEKVKTNVDEVTALDARFADLRFPLCTNLQPEPEVCASRGI
jgi:hypothetical protein